MTIDELHTLWDSKTAPQHRSRRSAVTEHDLQTACVRWFRLQYREFANLLIAIPNGGQRDVRVARKLKAEGVVAGVPDLFLAIARGQSHGMWIEMKNGKAGRVSEHQHYMLYALARQGYKGIVCRTFDEFREAVNSYMHII